MLVAGKQNYVRRLVCIFADGRANGCTAGLTRPLLNPFLSHVKARNIKDIYMASFAYCRKRRFLCQARLFTFIFTTSNKMKNESFDMTWIRHYLCFLVGFTQLDTIFHSWRYRIATIQWVYYGRVKRRSGGMVLGDLQKSYSHCASCGKPSNWER